MDMVLQFNFTTEYLPGENNEYTGPGSSQPHNEVPQAVGRRHGFGPHPALFSSKGFDNTWF